MKERIQKKVEQAKWNVTYYDQRLDDAKFELQMLEKALAEIEREECDHNGERKNGICLDCGKDV